MENVKASTKRGQDLLARAKSNEGTKLSDVYGNYSGAKAKAYDYCKRLYEEAQADNFRIISHNVYFFCVAFETKTKVYVITPAHDYCMNLEA